MSITSFLVCINSLAHIGLVQVWPVGASGSWSSYALWAPDRRRLREDHGWLLSWPVHLGMGWGALLLWKHESLQLTLKMLLPTLAVPWFAGNPAQQEAFLLLPRPVVLVLTLLHAVSLRARFVAHCVTLYYNKLGAHQSITVTETQFCLRNAVILVWYLETNLISSWIMSKCK